MDVRKRTIQRKQSIDICKPILYTQRMIRTFRSKPLSDLWAGKKTKIDAKLHTRILVRLDALNAAGRAEEMNIPGFDFHALRGFKPTRHTIHVNGPWCITFEFEDGDALRVDFDQYH